MKLSSSDRGGEPSAVAQHRPKYVHPPPSERDHDLIVPLLSRSSCDRSRSWSVGYGGLRRRLVEDSLEHLVASAHQAVVTEPLTESLAAGPAQAARWPALEKMGGSLTTTKNSAPRRGFMAGS